jgi:ABC-type nitrate/sulfonate/bicarbonate transport system permease component
MVKKSLFLRYPYLYFALIVLIVWIILFEFVFPANNFLPRPGIVFLSIPALFEDYHLIVNFLTTLSAVYLPGLLAYLLIFLFRQFIFDNSVVLSALIRFISGLTIFVPGILLALIFVFWFPHSIPAEYLFSFIVSLVWWLSEIKSKSSESNESYITAFKSLGADDSFISRNILWNEIKPGVFRNLQSFHVHLWGLLLMYEFILRVSGLGAILQKTLLYHDLSAICLIILIICLTIIAGCLFLRYIENKFIFWSAE